MSKSGTVYRMSVCIEILPVLSTCIHNRPVCCRNFRKTNELF